MITTEGSRQRVEEFLEKGAAGYIKKPFTPEQIKAILNPILGERNTNDTSDDFENCDDACDF